MAVSFFPLTDTVYGLTYEAHIKEYWKFFLKIPRASNPLEGRASCTAGQNLANPVFYLPCNLGGTTSPPLSCSIPPGKSVLIPVICIVIVFGEQSANGTKYNSIQDMHDSAYKDQDSVKDMGLQINGTSLNLSKLRNYRTHTREFQVDIPQGGLYNEGVNPAVSDGHYVITKPLRSGTYKVEIKGNIVCTGSKCFDAKFNTQHTVTLKVQP